MSPRKSAPFDGVAELYDQARPRYPAQLVADLVRLTGLTVGGRVLEIGCGTGQLTLPLAEHGVSLVAVEAGERLAAIASRNLARFPNARVIVSTFEDWELPDEPFDVVLAATAFHWLDEKSRVKKCVQALRPGGTLAIIDTLWGVSDSLDPFTVESQACYARWDRNSDPDYRPPTVADVPARHEELERSNLFRTVNLSRYGVQRTYTADGYCELLRTFSDVIGLAEDLRLGFLECVASLIDHRFQGKLTRRDLYQLWLAQTPG